MARCHEEASTNQAGSKRGTPWETPMASSLVAAMSVEDLRCDAPNSAPGVKRGCHFFFLFTINLLTLNLFIHIMLNI